MKLERKIPGNALQRNTGDEIGSQFGKTTMKTSYADCRDLQTRYLQRRLGINERTARLVAGFCFVEGR